MKAPDYWRRDTESWLPRLLQPVGWLYNVGSQMNQSAATPLKAALPVICVGNVVAGGAGKTPIALDIGKRLLAWGIDLHYLSRGYGGTEKGPHRVDEVTDKAARVGDEPILLSRVAPTWIARDRVAATSALVSAGAGAILMDDGLQNSALVKDATLCVIDGSYGIGNGRVMPAGPLRETLEDALKKSSAVVLMGDDEANIEGLIKALADPVPILKASLYPDDDPSQWTGKPVHAFAGIGNPEKFFRTLKGLNCDLKKTAPYPDHYVFNDKEISNMVSAAKSDNAVLITTEKDFVRLDSKWHDAVLALQVSVKWQDEASLESLLKPLFFDPA